MSTNKATIIWTPRFIVTFALVGVLGLSAESVLAEGLLGGYYPAGWVLLAHVVLVLGYWLLIVVRAHSWWIRTGGIFVCIWTLFTSISLILDLRSVDPSSAIITHLHAATASALLGSSICLSLDRTPLHRWDIWFFRFALVASGCGVALVYFLTPALARSLSVLENDIAVAVLVLCICVWWIRPSCWRARPGPTLLFGLVPTLLLLVSIPAIGKAETIFFLSQVVFLCLILGGMRILQCEHVNCETVN